MSSIRLSIGGALAMAVAAIGISSVALAQDQNPATPNEVIFARKALMNSIGANMYVIDQMLETGNIDPVSGRANADTISAMLMAFPHLFPNSTNLWTADNAARNPATDTLADAAHRESCFVLLQRIHGRIPICVRCKPRADGG